MTPLYFQLLSSSFLFPCKAYTNIIILIVFETGVGVYFTTNPPLKTSVFFPLRVKIGGYWGWGGLWKK